MAIWSAPTSCSANCRSSRRRISTCGWAASSINCGASTARFALRPADALAFISSNAATLGESALACRDVLELLRASIPVAGLSLLAVRGSAEAYAAPVHAGCPHPGRRRVADTMRAMLDEEDLTPARIQDPYGYRAFPQVHGPAVDAAEQGHDPGEIDSILAGLSEGGRQTTGAYRKTWR